MNQPKPQKISQVCISLMTIFFMLFSPIGNGVHPVIAKAPGGQMAVVNPLGLSNLSLYENSAPDSSVGLFSVTNPNEAYVYTYSLVDGEGSTDNSAFTISSDSLNIIAAPDYESKNSYAIRVRVSDDQPIPTLVENTFTITIIDLNEAPTDILLNNLSMDENVPAGSVVGTLSAVDPDQTALFTFNLLGVVNPDGSSNDNAAFSISGNTLKINAAPNYEVKASYSILVQVLDNGAPAMGYEKGFTLTVNDLNERPTSLNLSNNTIIENAPENARTLGVFSTTDPDLPAQTFSYSLIVSPNGTPVADNAAFTIVGDTLSLKAAPDYETTRNYLIYVRVTDSGTPAQFYDRLFRIFVTNVAEPPIVSSFSKSGPQNGSTSFRISDFFNHYSAIESSGSKFLDTVKIMGLPARGTLHLGSGPTLASGTEIPLASLDTLLYTPNAGTSGPDSFAWNGKNSIGYAPADAQVFLTIDGFVRRGVQVDPPGDAKSSAVGSAGYTFMITNTGEVSDSFTLTLDGVNPWTTTISTAHVSNLPPGARMGFGVRVDIPSAAVPDEFAESRVKIVSDADPTTTAIVKVTTTNTRPVPVPVVTSIVPRTVEYSASRSDFLTIRGINFTFPMQVTIGGQPATVRNTSNFLLRVDTPVGMAVGDYIVQVCDAANKCATSADKFSVLSPTPRLEYVYPNWGYNDTSNMVYILGYNLDQASFTLTGSTQNTLLQLQPVSATPREVRIKIPAGLPVDIYFLEACLQGNCRTLDGAYTVLEGSGNDFSAADEDLVPPGTIRQGQTIPIKLYVHHNGEMMSQAEVAFYRDDPSVPANKISPLDNPVTLQMGWGSVREVQIWWTLPAGLTGPVKIFAVIDPDGKLTEASKTNNTVSKTILILPREDLDEVAPVISSFTVVGGAQSTSNDLVQLSLLASDNVNGSGLSSMNLTELTYNTSARAWIKVKELRWIAYSSTPYFVLTPQPGIHYLQATVSDHKGNTSAMAEVSINYTGSVNILLDGGQIAFFRVDMNAGDTTKVQLSTQTGDADLYVWDQDGNQVVTSHNSGQTLDAVNFQALVRGQYQVEVVATVPSTCAINLAVPGPAPARPAISPAQVQTGEKVPRTQPTILTNNKPPEINPSTPAPISPTYMTYLPVLRK
jgi:hypothetical protein